MSTQRYERVSALDEEDVSTASQQDNNNNRQQSTIPNSPPPSFRSRNSSLTPSHTERSRLVSDADRTLADTFDSPSDDEDDHDERQLIDERQRAMSGRPSDIPMDHAETTTDSSVERHVTQLPAFPTSTTTGRVIGAGSNDGVFANLSAKVLPGEEVEEKPPTYEQAAADSAPPYWETTILSPGMTGDEVFIDGLPVGSLFSFVWNALISMSFQLVGFLLTYLLHTTHAAKHGSKAGLGITLVQYGFSMRSSLRNGSTAGGGGGGGVEGGNGADVVNPIGADPNSHDFDGAAAIRAAGVAAAAADDAAGMASGEWFAYAVMLVGWFILLRSIAEYVKARRHEQLVLQSPSRGLNVPVVASGESAESSV